MEDLILLVDDDIQSGQRLKDFFESNGLLVIWAKDGETAIKLLDEIYPRLILLEVRLPHKNGFEVAAAIRKISSVLPIIFMSGTALALEDFQKGYLLYQATNYIAKPINPNIVLAQIQGILDPSKIIKCTINNRRFSIEGQQLIIDEKEFQLRKKEIQVFSLLLENANSPVARKDILLKVWGDGENQQNNALDSSISHIRKILKGFTNVVIVTTYRRGYKLLIKEF